VDGVPDVALNLFYGVTCAALVPAAAPKSVMAKLRSLAANDQAG
jgi:hypothetical protein